MKTRCLIILGLLFCFVLLYCIVVLFPKRSYQSSRCLAVCFRVMSESCRSCQGNVWIMSGSSQGHVRVMSGSFQGHVRVMSGSCLGFVRVMSGSCLGYIRVLTGSCQLGLIGIVQFTRRLETEGFSVLFFRDKTKFYVCI